MASPYQHVHMADEPSILVCPPAAVVEAQKLKFLPARGVPIPNDEDLLSGAAEPLSMHLWYPVPSPMVENVVRPRDGDVAPDRPRDGDVAPDSQSSSSDTD